MENDNKQNRGDWLTSSLKAKEKLRELRRVGLGAPQYPEAMRLDMEAFMREVETGEKSAIADHNGPKSTVAFELPENLIEQARSAAVEDGVSFDNMLISLVASGLDRWRGMKMMMERASRADPGAIMTVLGKVPDVQPEPGDEPSDL